MEELIRDFDTIIFDFDGTLIDSEPFHKKAHSKVLSLILNKEISLTDEDFSRYIGKRDTEIFEMYKQDFNANFDKEKMINKKVEIARDLLLDENVKIFDYFFILLKEKKDKKFYVVSNQHPNILYPVLESKNIAKYFDNIFCLPKIDVKKQFFYENIAEFIPNSKKIAVFEDDANVLKFLKSLNFFTVGIESDINKNKLQNCCDKVISI